MDLRRHKRFPVHFHSAFTGLRFGESVGTGVNLSTKGCRIETAGLVHTGMRITLRMDVLGAGSPIHIELAAVRWSRGGEIGVSFLTVAPPDQARLNELLDRMKQDQQM